MTEENYEPSPEQWVRDQVETYERSGGTEGTTLRGLPVVLMTMTGATSGKTRKVPTMKVEHDGRYAVVASHRGAHEHPDWYYNLKANPRIRLQDGPDVYEMEARELEGDERGEWWQRAVQAFPDYADYQRKTDRKLPVFLLEPVVT